ncbi:uncharacterized protein LOC132041965 [Lycium ferocissimum]|uniref:uncharacterized protein LOC132041965 n=1 Tax=Lycium ferocissimum TaxID=112874 RepID=UPI002815593D|nr:uncharacterized protein LOC132041965 [Lycium ferocissimum]
MDVFRMVQAFYEGHTLPKSVTHTNLVLIPKKLEVHTFGDLRPISLCNFINKVISRVVHERLDKILPSLISSNQSSFVKGRSIIENVLLTQEIVTKIRKERVNTAKCGWLKCNSDSASRGNPGPSASAFCRAKAMHDGIIFCVTQQHLPLILETDSLGLMKIVEGEWEVPWSTLNIELFTDLPTVARRLEYQGRGISRSSLSALESVPKQILSNV